MVTRSAALPRLLRRIVGAAAFLYIAAYLLVAVLRMRHPFEIEFMEGNFLMQVGRVLSGQPLYVAPTLEYAPIAGGRLVDEISQIPGPVYVPYHAYLPVMAGKQSLADMMNLRFLLPASNREATEPLRVQLREALRQKRFSAVIVDADWNGEVIDEEYRRIFWRITRSGMKSPIRTTPRCA